MSRNVDDLRELLFKTIEDVRAGTIAPDKAQAIVDLAQVVVNSAKVEVQAAGGGDIGFLQKQEAKQLPPGITGIRQHRIGG